MSAVEVISEIKKMPKVQRRKVYQFVDEQLRREEDRLDNEAAERALTERGKNIPWMNGYRLEIRPSVEMTLRKIRDAKLQRRLDEAFVKLAENPRRMGAQKMTGFENRYRFRVGDYRIIYEIHDAMLLVLILAIGDRKEIYR
jgi:mRNA interferase RelE/StbE